MSTPSLYHVIADDIPATSITDKCIVIDLDQTLIATQDNIASLKELGILSNPELISLRNRVYHITLEDLEKPGIGTKYEFWGVTRPHVEEFLIFCFSYFKIVAVWSAGKRPYVEAIVDHLFRDIRKPHIIFTLDDIQVSQSGHVEKPLIKMIESHPVLRRHMSLQNTYALDDNPMTFAHNRDNALLIPAYLPPKPGKEKEQIPPNINELARDDPSLLQLKYWFLQPEVVNARDITMLDKTSIFSRSVDNYKERLQSLPGYRFIG
jgi:hypothetical protein